MAAAQPVKLVLTAGEACPDTNPISKESVSEKGGGGAGADRKRGHFDCLLLKTKPITMW